MATEVRPISAIGLVRAAGGLALLVVGGIHLEQYTAGHFSVVPTIGIAVPRQLRGGDGARPVAARARPGRISADCAWPSTAAVSLAGLGVAAGALVALLISEARPLFGFMEQGYRLEIVIALASEAIAIVLLGVFLALAVRPGTRTQAGDRRAQTPAGAAV